MMKTDPSKDSVAAADVSDDLEEVHHAIERLRGVLTRHARFLGGSSQLASEMADREARLVAVNRARDALFSASHTVYSAQLAIDFTSIEDQLVLYPAFPRDIAR
jgi:hypothetical protein